jgi:serine/threonine protein kinase
MSKVKIIDRKSEKSIKNEKEFLSQLHHPFLVNMICSFQDKDNLYLVMDLLNGGDLRYHICHKRKFSENETKFFLACVIIGLEYIHSKNIIHRDIKPENLVLDSNGYVAITDFGVAKKNMKDNSSETSGTPGYMAPEVLCAQNHSFPVDFFALGVMGFEFMNGYRPYLGRSRKEIKDAVLSKQARIHRKDAFEIGWSVESCDFINGMIYRKPDKRLGFNGIEEIKGHQWFNGFCWEELEGKKMKSFFIPKNGDNFDRKYCEGIEKIDSETRRRYSYYMSKDRYKDLFRNYTFVKKELLNGERKENLKGNFIINNSNRNTTTSSKSSGNNFIYGSNNIINREINNKKNDNNENWDKTPLRNPNYNHSTSLIKYMENNISNHSSHKNSNSNSLHNNKITSNNNSIIHNNKYIFSNNNSHHNSKHIISASAIPITYNKYSSLNIDRRNNVSNNKKLIFSPPH